MKIAVEISTPVRTMPYAANSDLPPSVRHVLPEHAQDIYRAAFNRAYERHHGTDEDVAHRIAWAAVKKSYRKIDGIWVSIGNLPRA